MIASVFPAGFIVEGDALVRDGRVVGSVREHERAIVVTDADAFRALFPEADVEGQGLTRSIMIGAIAFSITFGAPRAAFAREGAAPYALIKDANPKVHAHRAAPLLTDRRAIVGKTLIVVVRNTETEAHGDLPLVVERVEEREGRLVYVGRVVAPSAALPPDMQRQLRKDWYPAPGTTFEVHASDVRDILELRVADLP